jgi:hypothetical protein
MSQLTGQGPTGVRRQRQVAVLLRPRTALSPYAPDSRGAQCLARTCLALRRVGNRRVSGGLQGGRLCDQRFARLTHQFELPDRFLAEPQRNHSRERLEES